MVAKGNQSFKKLMEQGIADHIDEITEIGEIATKEYFIESSLDKMGYDIMQHKILTSVDEETSKLQYYLHAKRKDVLAKCYCICAIKGGIH